MNETIPEISVRIYLDDIWIEIETFAKVSVDKLRV